MTVPLNEMLDTQPKALIHDEKYRHVVEMHLQYFINSGQTDWVDIPPEKAYEFDGDFYGVCRTTGVAKDATTHWVNLRLNGMMHPFEYNADMVRIRVINPEALRILEQRYRMVHQSS